MWKINNEPYLAHHGIKGQKWGIRRYQNPDGSLTEEGRRRYGFDSELVRTGNKKKDFATNYRKLRDNYRKTTKELDNETEEYIKNKYKKDIEREKKSLIKDYDWDPNDSETDWKAYSIIATDAAEYWDTYDVTENAYKEMISTLKKEYGDKIDKWAKQIDIKDYKEGKINYYSYPVSRR